MSRLCNQPMNRAPTFTLPGASVGDGLERNGRRWGNGRLKSLLVRAMMVCSLTLFVVADVPAASANSHLDASANDRADTLAAGGKPQGLELSPLVEGQPPSPDADDPKPPKINGSHTLGPRRLSVAPGSRPLLPEDHPAWLSAEPDYDSKVHRLTVSSFPSVDQRELDAAMDEPLLSAVYEYLEEQIIERDLSQGIPQGLRKRITVDYIRLNLLPDPDGYTAQLQTSSGPMYQKWVRLEITPTQREQLTGWYREAVQLERVAILGIALLAILGLVGLVHLALRKRRGSPQASAVHATGGAGAAMGPSHQAGDAVAERNANSGSPRLIGLFVGMVVVGGVLLPLLVIGYFVVGSSRVVEYRVQPSETRPMFESDVRAEAGRLGEMADRHRREVHETLHRLRDQGVVVPRPPRADSGVSTSALSNVTTHTTHASTGTTDSASQAVVGEREDFEANSINQTE